MSIRRPCDKLITVPPKGKGMRTATAASVEPAGREEMSWVVRSKPWSARALLKRESERCSDRSEKASGQPGMFWKATACLQAGSTRFSQLERCSSACQSGAQIDQRRLAVNPACFEARALLKRELECCSDRPEKVNCQPGLFGRGMCREAT